MTLYREQRVVRKEYNYQRPVQFIRKIHGVLYPLAFLFYIIGVFGAIAEINSRNDLPFEYYFLLIPIFIIVWVMISVVIHIIPNIMLPIIVTPEGLKVQIFLFWFRWVFIPWDEVVNVVKSPIPGAGLSSVTVVQVKKLSLLHRFIGFIHIRNFSPRIIINSYIKDYEELIEVIKSNSIEKKM